MIKYIKHGQQISEILRGSVWKKLLQGKACPFSCIMYQLKVDVDKLNAVKVVVS